jgi:peptidase E
MEPALMSNSKPVFLLAGGRSSRQGKKKDTIMPALFKEIGRPSPSIGYIGVASDDDKEFFKFIAADFIKSGASEVSHALIAPSKADLVKTRELLNRVDAVFISGGDVERGMQVLEEKNMIDFLRELYLQGKMFFGASAGSIMLAREWVRWRDPNDDSSVELFPCLGFAPVLCDTHAESDNWEELRTALSLKNDITQGYGIATGSGLKVSTESRVEALGGPVALYVNEAGEVNRKADILPSL